MANEKDFEIEHGVLTNYKGKAKNVVIPEGVTSIGDSAFYWCERLTSINIPDSVTSIGDRAFSECKSLRSINIPDSVTSIGDCAFSLCTNLTTITIPDSVTSIGNGAFSRCTSLTSVTIPDSVTSIGDSTFEECTSLTSINIPDRVTSTGNKAFYNCKGLADKNGLVIVRGVLYWCERNQQSVAIPDSVTSIGDSAFSSFYNLTSINIPDSVTSIGDSAFWNCESLTSINIPNSVTSIGDQAFYECKSLTSITIPDSVTSIGDKAFSSCVKLRTIKISNSVTSIGSQAFCGCKAIKSITIPSALAKELAAILPETKEPILVHVPDITNVSTKFRPGAAAAFAEDNRDCTDENGKKYTKYIKANAAKLIGIAISHPALLYLMLREKLIAAKNLEAVTQAVQKTGNTELIAAVLEYGHSSVSEKDKAKVAQRKETRETNVTIFVFDALNLQVLQGKTIVVTGKLKTFTSRDELMACLEASGATLTETLNKGVDYLLTNTPNSGTAKNKKAVELGIKLITEDEFNAMIGRTVTE